ncbi:hypothetical protein RhiirC2_771531 [Rhizophagus irregularis]|uniref:DUF8211 domain-containing protein n=1 Tax=Rhizophagus irregularis TaxID=588596 RepID=A0A2N1NTQ5_9GLOM|nr:hypothetical protein RhiirC2_771531 [Rhizophagus irregularis]
MSYFPRADDFAPALGYDHTPAEPDDFIFNHNTTQTVPPIDNTLSDTPSLHNNFDDIRPFFRLTKTIFSLQNTKIGPLTNIVAICSIPVPFTMSRHRYACIIHHKNLVLYFISKDNKIPDDSDCKTFKDFHASRLYNRWAKKKKYHNFSNRLGISFTTSYHAYNTNVVATKGFNFIYGKRYGNLQFTPSSSSKIKKRQEAQNQHFTAPIKHFRYKKKFVEPSKDYYTFLIPSPEPKTVSAPATTETTCNVSSVISTVNCDRIPVTTTDNWENVPEHYIPLIPQYAIYEGGRLNQPSRMKVRKKKLQPLAIGSDGWLAYMKEIYDDHCTSMKHEQHRIDAGIKWDTTPDQGEYWEDLCNLVIEVTNAHHNYQRKLVELFIEVTPEVPSVSGYLPKKELRFWVNIYEYSFIIGYYRDEIGLAFQPCAIMDDRPLKRRANDNGNLDTHYGYHINKKDNKIPDVSHCKTFKNFHASRLYNRWAKKKKYQNFSNRLGISFTTSYHAYNTNVVATKGLDFIYGKKYGNLQFTPSSSPKVKKRQEAHFNALKKFVEPSKGYYTFPIPFPETKTVSAPAIAETTCNVSSVTSTSNRDRISFSTTDNWENVPEHYIPLIPQSAIYEGGRLNQPSRMKVWKKKLQPLAVGSDGWLAHMKEIYDNHSMLTKYEQDRIIAGIKWDTTPDQGEYRKDLCNLVMEVTDAHHNYELKLLELSIEVTPEVPPVSGHLSKSEYKKREKRRKEKELKLAQKKREDTKILEELRSWVNTYEDAFIIGYYRDEIGLAFQPCTIMDDKPLKRRANDNGNLDTHYGYHINKKVCILSASKDSGNSSSARTI